MDHSSPPFLKVCSSVPGFHNHRKAEEGHGVWSRTSAGGKKFPKKPVNRANLKRFFRFRLQGAQKRPMVVTLHAGDRCDKTEGRSAGC